MPIVLDGTAGITASAIDAALDASNLTGNVAAARITTALNATGSAPIFAARAWVNFNGTGTVAIRASGNVSSISDNGTGDYTVNFTTAMPDANYGVAACGTFNATGTSRDQNINIKNNSAPTTTSFRVQAFEPNTGGVDTLFSNLTVFR